MVTTGAIALASFGQHVLNQAVKCMEKLVAATRLGPDVASLLRGDDKEARLRLPRACRARGNYHNYPLSKDVTEGLGAAPLSLPISKENLWKAESRASGASRCYSRCFSTPVSYLRK